MTPLPERQTASEQAYHALSRMILEGVYGPGDGLPPERQLSEQLGVSRPTLRSALSRLAAQGHVIRKHGGGTFVAKAPDNPLAKLLLHEFKGDLHFRDDMLEFRICLETASARLAAEQATPACLRVMEERLEKWRSLFVGRAKTGWAETEADLAFHLSIADASHNLVFPYFMRLIFGLLREHILENLESYDSEEWDRQLLLEEHEGIFEAIQKGRAEEAEVTMQNHLSRVRSVLQKSLDFHQRVSLTHRRNSAGGKAELRE